MLVRCALCRGSSAGTQAHILSTTAIPSASRAFAACAQVWFLFSFVVFLPRSCAAGMAVSPGEEALDASRAHQNGRNGRTSSYEDLHQPSVDLNRPSTAWSQSMANDSRTRLSDLQRHSSSGVSCELGRQDSAIDLQRTSGSGEPIIAAATCSLPVHPESAQSSVTCPGLMCCPAVLLAAMLRSGRRVSM